MAKPKDLRLSEAAHLGDKEELVMYSRVGEPRLALFINHREAFLEKPKGLLGVAGISHIKATADDRPAHEVPVPGPAVEIGHLEQEVGGEAELTSIGSQR